MTSFKVNTPPSYGDPLGPAMVAVQLNRSSEATGFKVYPSSLSFSFDFSRSLSSFVRRFKAIWEQEHEQEEKEKEKKEKEKKEKKVPIQGEKVSNPIY